MGQQSTTRIVGSRASRSARSELITVASWRRAVSTTVASMTSAVPAVLHSTPAARAPRSLSGSTRTSRALRSRPSLAWRARPPLHAWPTTPAGTNTARCSRRATSISVAVSRSPRSMTIKAPASKTNVNAARPMPDAHGPWDSTPSSGPGVSRPPHDGNQGGTGEDASCGDAAGTRSHRMVEVVTSTTCCPRPPPGLFREPESGIEPLTYALRVRCSAV